MTILITGPGTFVTQGSEEPMVGTKYALEDLTEGTAAQNRLFHPLALEFWQSGLHSSRARDFAEFRDEIKRDLGAGFEKFVYAEVDDSGTVFLRQVDTYDEVPEYIRKSPRRNELVRGRLKSWADYTKKERRLTIDRLIDTMVQAGVNSKRFQEIMTTIQGG